MGQFLPSPEQLPKVELDVFGISPSIYWVCVVLFICLLLPLFTCENNYELNAWNKIIIIIIILTATGYCASSTAGACGEMCEGSWFWKMYKDVIGKFK